MISSDEVKSIDLYPELIHEEDLTPDCGVEIDETCEKIHKACKGWGTDEDALIEALGNTIPEDRLKISLRYGDIYDKSLKSVMKKEVGGDFGKAMKYLALNPVEAECKMIKDACKGIGSQKKILYSILCGRSNRDMELLKKTYYKFYSADITTLITSESGGDIRKIFSACLQAAEEEFDPDYHTDDQAKEDAEDIYKAGQGRWGTDEVKLFKLIVLAPPKYLSMVNAQYADKYGYTLAKAMEKELSGDAKDAAIFTVNMRLKPYEAIAGIIKAACRGLGTDEDLLTTCIIRYQDLMGHVNFAHEELYGKSVHDRVRSEVSGDYKKVLLALLSKVSPEN